MKRVNNIFCRKSSTTKSERGVVAVELAMMLPLLVVCFLTIIDLSLVIHEHQILQNAAREAARFSALPRNQIGPLNPVASANAVRQRVIDYCAERSITVPVGDISVSQQHPINVGALTVMGSEVTVSYTRPLLVAGAPFLPVGNVVLSGRAVFRNLY
jgi:Flp pilus assembly protein TadG